MSIEREHDEIDDYQKPKSRAESIETVATYNPILGFSESEPK